jgi:hypothetical protein
MSPASQCTPYLPLFKAALVLGWNDRGSPVTTATQVTGVMRALIVPIIVEGM